jgi:hypothetical protein
MARYAVQVMLPDAGPKHWFWVGDGSYQFSPGSPSPEIEEGVKIFASKADADEYAMREVLLGVIEVRVVTLP